MRNGKLIALGIGIAILATANSNMSAARLPRRKPRIPVKTGPGLRPTGAERDAFEAVFDDSKAWAVLIWALVLMSVALTLFAILDGRFAALDFLAYAAPIAAAIFGGFTAFSEGARSRLFLATIFWLYVGAVAYMGPRGHGATVLTVITDLAFLGIELYALRTLICVWGAPTREARSATVQDYRARAFLLGAIIAVAAVIVWLAIFSYGISKCVEQHSTPGCFDLWPMSWLLSVSHYLAHQG